MRLGVVGGTFDPIHHGHLIAGEEARVGLGLDLVLFVPAGRPPHKSDRKIGSMEHRGRMIELAIGSNPHFRLSTVDAEKRGPSYTIDMLARLRLEWGGAAELFFIMGTDSLNDLMSWYHPERLFGQARIVACTRPGNTPIDLDELGRRLPESAGKVDILPIPAVDIASSEIRDRLAAGLPIKYQVPEAVEDYIFEHGLYDASRARVPPRAPLARLGSAG